MANESSVKSNLYTVGCNGCGRLGLGHTKNVTQLTQLPNTIDITAIDCGYEFTIFTTLTGEYYAVGLNDGGQCAVNSHDKSITKSTAIGYFNTLNLKVHKIFANCNGESVFWLTNDGKIYGNGWNDTYQLGLSDKKHRIKPEIVWGLNEYQIKDIKNGERHSIALAQNGTVFGAGNKDRIGLENDNEYKNGEWNIIQFFKNINIIQIECGMSHSLFLTFDGRVYSGGRNEVQMEDFGQLGRGEDCPDTIQKIKYFSDKSIIIKDIKCGMYHNLALDESGNVYAWGSNKYGQCGFKSECEDDYVYIPKLLDTVKGEQIIDIKCGSDHSCFKTESGQYWMFGKNNYNQVTLEKSNEDKIYKPLRINNTFIKDIFLGMDCTFITSFRLDILAFGYIRELALLNKSDMPKELQQICLDML